MRMSLLILALGAFFFLSTRRRIRGSATTGPVNRPMGGGEDSGDSRSISLTEPPL